MYLFSTKKLVLRKLIWLEQIDIISPVRSGILRTDATSESFFLNSQRIEVVGCNGCLRRKRRYPKEPSVNCWKTAQEFNKGKQRKGALWDDRYHATAIEAGEHLLRCLV